MWVTSARTPQSAGDRRSQRAGLSGSPSDPSISPGVSPELHQNVLQADSVFILHLCHLKHIIITVNEEPEHNNFTLILQIKHDLIFFLFSDVPGFQIHRFCKRSRKQSFFIKEDTYCTVKTGDHSFSD